MKLLKSSILIIIGWAFLSSCGTLNKANSKLVVGSWKYEKITGFKSSASEISELEKSQSSSGISEAIEMKKMIKEPSTTNDLSAMLAKFPEMITALEFKSDHTARVVTKKTTINGTWKLNGKGLIIKITSMDPKKVTPIEIRHIDLNSLEIIDPFSGCSIGNSVLLFKKD